MPGRSAYPPPGNAILRWIGDTGSNMPVDVQRQLRSVFFTSKAPIILGSVNTCVVATIAWLHTGIFLLAVIAGLDCVLVVVRLLLQLRTRAPSGPIFAGGLLFALLQGATVCLVVSSGNPALTLLVVSSAFATVGGIIGRNFAAPRYALLQVLVIDGCFKISFLWRYPEYWPLVVIQAVVFILISVKILHQQHETTTKALLGEIESRERSVTDSLTGLANRRGLEDAFCKGASAKATRSLLYLDLDDFKKTNDRFGHDAGDELLRQVAARMRDVAGPEPLLCRLGGDEFVILAERLSAGEAQRLGGRLIASLCVPYRLGDHVLASVGASVGVASEAGDGAALGDMLRRADRALYRAKASGKGTCFLDDRSDEEAVEEEAGPAAHVA